MKSRAYLVMLVSSFIIVLASIYVPQTAHTKSDLLQVKCGLPLNYLIQDMSRRDPPYPWQMSCGFYALEEPTYVLWPRLILDVAILFAVIVVAVHSSVLLFKRFRQDCKIARKSL